MSRHYADRADSGHGADIHSNGTNRRTPRNGTSGRGNTHAGLLFGLRALGCPVRVTGVCVRRRAEAQAGRIRSHCREIAGLLGLEPAVDDADIHLIDDFLAPGYGRLNDLAVRAIGMAARLEGLILDPRGRSLLFIHTGGAPALFAYGPALTGR